MAVAHPCKICMQGICKNFIWVISVLSASLSMTDGWTATRPAQRGAPHCSYPRNILADAFTAANPASLSYMLTTVLVIMPNQLNPCSAAVYATTSPKALGAQHAEDMTMACYHMSADTKLYQYLRSSPASGHLH